MSDKLEHFDGCYQHSGAALPWDDTCTCGASEIAALQARLAECERENEDLKLAAQYGWKDGEPPKWLDEWFLARTTFGPSVLARLPEEYAYDYKTSDETYIKAEHVKRWMQLPGSEYKPMNCECDTLRAEVARLNALLEADGDALKGRAVTIAGLRAQLAETQRLLEVQLAVGDKLTAEVARLADCLKKANNQTEDYERRYYLEQQLREDKEAELAALRAIGKRIIANAGDFTKEFELHEEIEALRDALGR